MNTTETTETATTQEQLGDGVQQQETKDIQDVQGEQKNSVITLPQQNVQNLKKYFEDWGVQVPEKEEELGAVSIEDFTRQVNKTFEHRLANSESQFFTDIRNNYRDKYTREAQDKFTNELVNKFYISQEDANGKTVSELIDMASKVATQSKDETTAKLQKTANELQMENNRLKEEVIPEIRRQVEKERADFMRERMILDVITNLDTGSIKSEVIYNAVNPVLNSRYNIEYNENSKSLDFTNKSTGTRISNSNDTGVKSYHDIIAEEVKETGLLSLSRANNLEENQHNQHQNQQNQQKNQNNNSTVHTVSNGGRVHPNAIQRREKLASLK